ncbi:MAG: hypothetical protein GX051_06910 [Clostridiales bacterium]|nr:hypothetical protein [Clostridiales bacterium]
MATVIKDLIALIALLCVLISSNAELLKRRNTVDINIDASATGKTLSNMASNVNVWDMGTTFFEPDPEQENNVFEFVKYVQLMQCTGGTAQRDLFIDPYDTSTYTDYDFSRLIKNCRGILTLGAKPHLKLGGVPLKFTSGYELGNFEMNMYPPDDYNLYYDYIKAIAQALSDEFGADEVLTWRFGCMTEYENSDWFMAKSKNPEDSAEAFCKLYDYTVQALVDVLGDNVFVGAHSMSVTEGLWDEALFIEHIARGTNYANGGTGTRVCFLSASFYDSQPGQFTLGKTLPETIAYLRNTAESFGLNNLIYGIDEGRLLCGNTSGANDSQLFNRTVGFTWQAAYDARIYKQGIDSGLDYFSSWGYLSNGLTDGYPTVSYHVAKNLSEFSDGAVAHTSLTPNRLGKDVEVGCVSVWDEHTATLHVMAYNFKNDIDYDGSVELNFALNIPQLDGKNVSIKRSLVSDECNYFDEWQQDRKEYDIGDDCFSWSPDDPCIDNTTTLSDAAARELYYSTLRSKYIEASRLIPVTESAQVVDGKLKISETLGASNVIFYEIKAAG